MHAGPLLVASEHNAGFATQPMREIGPTAFDSARVNPPSNQSQNHERRNAEQQCLRSPGRFLSLIGLPLADEARLQLRPAVIENRGVSIEGMQSFGFFSFDGIESVLKHARQI